MANKIFNTRVKNKRDTEANWTRKNPVLLDGEIIIVTTTSGDTRFKVGDGKKTYNQLPFQDQKTRDLIPSVDSSLSSTSTNPVQNKIIKSELDKKAERDVVNTTTNGLMSVADKKKLDGIATGATKITVDTALSSTSTNPVQNKAVKTELDKKADKTALDNKFDKAGGTLTGNLTGKYITGTWLQTTEATDLGRTPGNIAVLDESGLVYYRTLTEIKTDIGVDVSSLVDLFYPIGSIYMSTNQTDDPQSRFSGTYWLPIYDSFLLGAGNTYKAKATGGEATHTLTQNEMPKHNHVIYYPNGGAPDTGAALGFPEAGSKNTWWAEACMTGQTGGSAAHNNMPPYYAVYMWRRVTFQEYEAGADGG